MLGRRPRPKAHKLADSVINEAVQGLLDKQWSPEQISVSLAKRTEAVLISPESIYRGVFNPLIPLRREKALRTRSEISGIDVEHLERHEHGMILHIPTSKMNQTGEEEELVALPLLPNPRPLPNRRDRRLAKSNRHYQRPVTTWAYQTRHSPWRTDR